VSCHLRVTVPFDSIGKRTQNESPTPQEVESDVCILCVRVRVLACACVYVARIYTSGMWSVSTIRSAISLRFISCLALGPVLPCKPSRLLWHSGLAGTARSFSSEALVTVFSLHRSAGLSLSPSLSSCVCVCVCVCMCVCKCQESGRNGNEVYNKRTRRELHGESKARGNELGPLQTSVSFLRFFQTFW